MSQRREACAWLSLSFAIKPGSRSRTVLDLLGKCLNAVSGLGCDERVGKLQLGSGACHLGGGRRLQWARRFRFDWTAWEEALWQWRMGWNQAPDVIGFGFGAHGIGNVTCRDKFKKENTEFFAFYGGKRRFAGSAYLPRQWC